MDTLFETFTREELCTEWHGHGHRRTFIWHLAHFNPFTTHNYLLDRIVPTLLTKLPPEEFLHKVVRLSITSHNTYVVPAIFCEICAYCDVETVRIVHLHIQDTMSETGVTLTHPVPRDTPYEESNDFVLAALKHNTPDVCAYLWQEARAEDPALATECAVRWLQKIPQEEEETRKILQPMVKSAAAAS